MKQFLIVLGVVALASCHASVIPNKECTLQKIPAISTSPSRNEIYVARGKVIEVQFRNENAPITAEVFPDPLITVKNLTSSKSCDIKDGNGIWSGKSIYLDEIGRAHV